MSGKGEVSKDPTASTTRQICFSLFLTFFSKNDRRESDQAESKYRGHHMQRKIKEYIRFRIYEVIDSFYRNDLTNYMFTLILNDFY